MRVVFMGTPEFAVAVLRQIVEAGWDVAAAYTQPDKPKNRGMKLVPTPVKEYALTQNIPVYQPSPAGTRRFWRSFGLWSPM